jgi:hypothetical protein
MNELELRNQDICNEERDQGGAAHSLHVTRFKAEGGDSVQRRELVYGKYDDSIVRSAFVRSSKLVPLTSLL